MARQVSRLSAKAVSSRLKPGKYPDGAGLYLQVGPTGTKSWIFRYQRGINANPDPNYPAAAGKPKQNEMGLGNLLAVSLAEAREQAAECRRLLNAKIDPITARDKLAAEAAIARGRSVSFQHCAEKYVTAHKPKWKNEKHIAQWESTLKTYAGPVVGALSVHEINDEMILKILEPIWSTKPETATRLRARIEAVLDWAKASKYRSGENPARWKGHLDQLLPAIPKKMRVQHHPALPYDQIGNFVGTIQAEDGIAPRALEFLILTATRTGEVIGATSTEFDLKKAIWTIPAYRTKAGREHRVPLTPRAIELVREQMKLGGKYLFPGHRIGKPLSNMAMLALLGRIGRDDLTVHGFRSTFKDWAAECTGYPNLVSEMALGHSVDDEVEAAYRRGDLLQKRTRLMSDWAKFCSRPTKGGKVTPIRKAS